MSCSFTSSLTSSDLWIIITKGQLKYAGSIPPHKKRVWSPVLEKGIWFTNIFVSALFAAFSIFNAYNNLVRQMIQQKIKQFLKFFRNYGKKCISILVLPFWQTDLDWTIHILWKAGLHRNVYTIHLLIYSYMLQPLQWYFCWKE